MQPAPRCGTAPASTPSSCWHASSTATTPHGKHRGPRLPLRAVSPLAPDAEALSPPAHHGLSLGGAPTPPWMPQAAPRCRRPRPPAEAAFPASVARRHAEARDRSGPRVHTSGPPTSPGLAAVAAPSRSLRPPVIHRCTSVRGGAQRRPDPVHVQHFIHSQRHGAAVLSNASSTRRRTFERNLGRILDPPTSQRGRVLPSPTGRDTRSRSERDCGSDVPRRVGYVLDSSGLASSFGLSATSEARFAGRAKSYFCARCSVWA